MDPTRWILVLGFGIAWALLLVACRGETKAERRRTESRQITGYKVGSARGRGRW